MLLLLSVCLFIVAQLQIALISIHLDEEEEEEKYS